ncbi:hypothetical protein EDF62_2526 [Leucobacter luti]|uniref:Peptide subunit release factor 1 (ERF1) n=1 Tax=Leucobacter luti TaxID=340320 RepID=A0A4R6RV73_9MICO|nr:hypothetical protein [Leucobacter luti]TDP90871.1 hypothetical protein EDF62_2526 [Leucobacter luti]
MHTDIPQRPEVEHLAAVSSPHLVTIVLRTTPVTTEAEAARITFGTLTTQAIARLTELGGSPTEIERTAAGLRALHDDAHLWRYLSHSLVVFASPERTISYRLPNELESEWFAGSHFRIVPILRTLTYPHEARVLALSQNAVRLIAIEPDHPGVEVPVPELPSDLLDTFNVEDPGIESHQRRLHSPEGQTPRLLAYTRAVDRAIAPVLRATRVPLILAATQPLAGMFRSITSATELLDATIDGNPDERTAAELDEAARTILDAHYAAELAADAERFETRRANGKAVTDLTDVARAAVAGAVATLYVDIDAHPVGALDTLTGTVSAESDPGRSLVDQIAAQVLAHGGRVLPLRRGEVPGGGELGAEVRFSV